MSENKKEEKKPLKKKYVKPEIKSESLMSFGAVCNGSSIGGKKASINAPSFCNSRKLLS